MDIALITLEGGGISTVCYGLASSLSKRKIHTTVFTETSGRRQTKNMNQFLRIECLHRSNIPPRFFWFQFQNFGMFSQLIGRHTLVHGIYPDASTVFALHKKKLRRPFVVSFHAEPLSNTKKFFDSPISSWIPSEFAHHVLEYPLHSLNLKKCIKSADHIIVCSFTSLTQFKAAYKDLNLDNVSVIYNSVNLDEINSVRVGCENYKENAHPSILFAGRLFWLKGPMFLLKAFEILRRDLKDVNLKIFGDGPEEPRLKKFVSLNGMDPQVHFHKRIPHKDMIAEIKKADVVVAPSLSEAQSLFVLEAMACGKPLITFDIPPMKEIITDGFNGLMAKSFDIGDLSEKIRVVLNDRKLACKIGQNAHNYIRLRHNWENQVDQYLQIYESVTNKVGTIRACSD
jgi:glycosyltransferase involved in cell wall biosynthesis